MTQPHSAAPNYSGITSHSLANHQNPMRNLTTYIVVLVRVLYRVMALDTRSFFVLWRAAILAAGLLRPGQSRAWQLGKLQGCRRMRPRVGTKQTFFGWGHDAYGSAI
jgi:hypothetical protein